MSSVPGGSFRINLIPAFVKCPLSPEGTPGACNGYVQTLIAKESKNDITRPRNSKAINSRTDELYG